MYTWKIFEVYRFANVRNSLAIPNISPVSRPAARRITRSHGHVEKMLIPVDVAADIQNCETNLGHFYIARERREFHVALSCSPLRSFHVALVNHESNGSSRRFFIFLTDIRLDLGHAVYKCAFFSVQFRAATWGKQRYS